MTSPEHLATAMRSHGVVGGTKMSEFQGTSSPSPESSSASAGTDQHAGTTGEVGQPGEHGDDFESSAQAPDGGADASNRAERGALSSPADHGDASVERSPEGDSGNGRGSPGDVHAVETLEGHDDDHVIADAQMRPGDVPDSNPEDARQAAEGDGGMSGDGYSASGTLPPQRSDARDPAPQAAEAAKEEPASPADGEGGMSGDGYSASGTLPPQRSDATDPDPDKVADDADLAEQIRESDEFGSRTGELAEKGGTAAEGANAVREGATMVQEGAKAGAEASADGAGPLEIIENVLGGIANELGETTGGILIMESVRQDIDKIAGVQDPKDGA
jgi:hypothetical protein